MAAILAERVKIRPSTSRRCMARWRRARGSRGRARRAGPAQDRARDLDRGDVVDDRGRPRRDRQRPHARAALRARHRPHAAGDGSGLARQRRSKARPRRARRAGCVLSALGGGGEWRFPALRASRNPQRRSLQFRARSRVLGRRRSRAAEIPRSAAARRARRGARATRHSRRAGRAGRITDEGRAISRLALAPRLARMLVDAARVGARGWPPI